VSIKDVRLDAMSFIDGFLTSKALDVFEAEARVLKLTDGRDWIVYVLRRPGRDDVRLGHKFFEARSALGALIKAERMRQRGNAGR